MPKTKEYAPGTWHIHCPGCGSEHSIWTINPNSLGAMWEFNGDVEKPTFNPSVRVTWPQWTTDEAGVQTKKEHCCHFFIREGNIVYCGDCTHELSGQTLPLQEVN